MSSLPSEPSQCVLCKRFSKRGTTEHHLIPRTLHSNRWFQKRYSRQEMQQTISVCPDCHAAIHRFIPREKELGRHYNTIDALREHKQIARFITWVRKQR